MRLKILAILLALLAVGCGTNPVAGKWKATRAYDFRSQSWTEFQTDAIVEVSNDGKFKAYLPDGSQIAGEYKLDETVNPHRFTATDRAKKTVRGIYKVAGDELTVRGTDESVDLEFLQSLDPSEDKTTFPLVEFERQ